ncbi:MAG: MFS transporter [Patescibacteria group bacterium]|jgi:YQGE family putative transporter|nr:MFS transporter [Patescibacteria group bacterium]
MNNNAISSIDIKRLLASHNIFIAARVFFEIYLNVFIWKQTESLVLIAWFNIAYVLFQLFGFHIFAYFVKRGRVHFARAFSLLGFTVTYLTIFLLAENAIQWIVLIGGFAGFFNGVYRIAYQVLRFDLTHSQNRGNYTGLESGTKTIVDIVMPLLAGAIIALNFFDFGYSSLFLLGTVLFLISFFVGKVSFPLGDKGSFHFMTTWREIRKNRDLMKSMWSYFFSNFSRGGTITKLILPLLIFDAMQSELQLGGWLSFFSIMAVFISFAFGKFVHYKKYKNMLLIGGIFYFFLLLLLVLVPKFWVFILFGALIKIVDLLIKIPKRVISENLIDSIPNASSHRIENIVIREWFNIALGRLLSLVFLLFVVDLEVSQMKLFLLLVAFGALFEALLLRSIKKEI